MSAVGRRPAESTPCSTGAAVRGRRLWRGPSRPASRSPIASVEVATLAARGRTSPEIAEALHLSVRTVDTHLSRVYRKLQIDGRHELAAALGIATPAGRPTASRSDT